MEKKLTSTFIVVVLLTIIMPISIVSGGIEEPQITDESGDAFGYIDIDSVWFFEKPNSPDFLYVSMKINDPSRNIFQQTFAAFWTYENEEYSVSLHLGFSFKNWTMYRSGIQDDRKTITEKIEGSYDFNTGIITWAVPKENIGNPQEGDILTNTWSNAFRRLGFIGRIGFTRHVLDAIILQVFGNNMWDYAPERGEYGLNYQIQY